MKAENEYAIQFCRDHWKVHRLDGHHGSYLGCYEVRLEIDDTVQCNCPAPGWCKHLDMILTDEEPKVETER